MESGQVVNESGQKPRVGGNGGKNGGGRGITVRGLSEINGWYYFRAAQVEGVRPAREALGTRDFDEAVSLALGRQREADVTNRAGALDFEARRAIAQRKYHSRWTKDADESVLAVFVKFAGAKMQASSVSTALIERWRDALLLAGPEGEPLTKGSVVTYLARVSSFFGWLRKEGCVARNPVKGVKVAGGSVKKTRVERFCTKPERALLLRLVMTHRSRAFTVWTEPRPLLAVRFMGYREDLALVLMLGFHAGMRLNEIVQARPDWLRFWPGSAGSIDGAPVEWHGEIVVQKTATFTPKDKEARAIPMNRVLIEFLLPRRGEGKPFLLRPDVEQGEDKYRWNPRRPFGDLVAIAKLGWVGVHTMRHTYATHLVMGGVPIKTVAVWLGDDEITTARTYAGYLPNRAHVEAGL